MVLQTSLPQIGALTFFHALTTVAIERQQHCAYINGSLIFFRWIDSYYSTYSIVPYQSNCVNAMCACLQTQKEKKSAIEFTKNWFWSHTLLFDCNVARLHLRNIKCNRNPNRQIKRAQTHFFHELIFRSILVNSIQISQRSAFNWWSAQDNCKSTKNYIDQRTNKVMTRRNVHRSKLKSRTSYVVSTHRRLKRIHHIWADYYVCHRW